jgi:nitrile hydratase subunit beta
VDGPHNLGGRQGFGTIGYEPGAPAFHEDWERRVFGIAACSWTTPWIAFDEFRDAIYRMPPAQYLGSSYFERWLYAVQSLIERKGLPPRTDAAAMTASVISMVEQGVPRERPAPADPAFGVGDRVRARVIHPRGYDRLPSYVKGRRGVIHAHTGAFWHPEDLARGETGGAGEHCYTVRFSAAELWGPDAEGSEDALCVDLFENYLERG